MVKRQGRPANVNAASGQNGYLLHVIDLNEGSRWLVDGGALVSIVPPTRAQRRHGPNGTELCAANGTKIKCFGTTDKTLRIGNKSFPFTFTIADVRQRILGADFLAQFYLAPNHRDGSLIELDSLNVLPATFARGVTSNPVTFVNEVNDPFYRTLDSFPEILTPSFKPVEVQHGVRHHIPTNGRPVQSRARKLDPEKLRVAKAEIDKLCKLGVCRRAKSEWASPLMVARKPCVRPCTCTSTTPCGGWRVCGDYRRLNSMTPDDKYPVRAIHDFNAELHGKKVFSKIDLMKGYHQIPVANEDVCKTGIITPFGLFEFPRTPFGLKNAGQDFQRLMDSILGDVPRVFVYIDDILVASEDEEQHIEDLKTVFTILSNNGLVVQRSKCVLGKTALAFLGYKVDADGVSPLPDRVEAIRAVNPPTNIKELQSFLGLINYYRRFVAKAAQHLHPLFEALKGRPNKPKPRLLKWTPHLQSSFDAIKEALAKATLLHHPRPGAELALTTDASKLAIGGVLEQRGPRGWEPLSFYSAKLQPHQQLWPPYDRELLAAFKSVRHFKSMVEGRNFILFTDHQSLVPSMTKKADPQTARQTYQLACVSEYTTDIRYVEGKSNVVADALSRPPEPQFIATIQEPRNASPTEPRPSPCLVPENAIQDLTAVINAVGPLSIDLESMAQEQTLDPDYRRLSTEARTGLNFRKVNIGNTQLIVDVSNGPARPFVPFSWRRRIFEAVHNLGHPGVGRTRQMITSKFVWPSVRQDAAKWARECLPCQQAKVNRHTVPPIGDFAVPSKRFQHWNVDIVTMPTSNGYRYLLTAIDRFSRWPVAAPMTDMTASTVLDTFSHSIISSFGVPESITTDNGTQFCSTIWRQLMRVWGIKSHYTTPYHPASNGLVERFHRRLKESLNALGADDPNQWFWKLPCSMLAIRTTIKPDIGASPADLVFGEGLSVPGDTLGSGPPSDEEMQRERSNLLDHLHLEVSRLQPSQTSTHRRPAVFVPEDLRRATHVFVRRGGVQPSLASPYVGPFRVLSRQPNFFKIAIPGSASENVSIARLKPATIAENDAPAPPSPPRHDRQPHPPRRPPPPSSSNTRQPQVLPEQIFDPTVDLDDGEDDDDSNNDDEEETFLARLRRLRKTERRLDSSSDNDTDDSNATEPDRSSSDPPGNANDPPDPRRIPDDIAAGPSEQRGEDANPEAPVALEDQGNPPANIEPLPAQRRVPGAGGHRGGSWHPRDRPRPDVSALAKIIQEHLNESS